jgi:hypothetical protein
VVIAVGVAAVIAGVYWGLARSPDDPPISSFADPSQVTAPRAGCAATRGTVADARLGRVWTGVYECPNTPAVDVYEHPRPGVVVGELVSNPSWFICWIKGERHEGGNDIWYYTQGDHTAAKKELEAWGFVPGYLLRVEVHPDPGVARQCPPI